MFDKEVAQFIRSCTDLKLVNKFSHEAQHMLHTIKSDNPFDVLFLDGGYKERFTIPN